MNFYFCACAACTWKGKKPHRDGQCPVCGHSLEIQIRERRYSPDLASKVVLSGLSSDQKIKAPLPDLSILNRYKFSEQDLNGLFQSVGAIRAYISDSVSKIRLSNDSLKVLVMRLLDED